MTVVRFVFPVLLYNLLTLFLLLRVTLECTHVTGSEKPSREVPEKTWSCILQHMPDISQR